MSHLPLISQHTQPQFPACEMDLIVGHLRWLEMWNNTWEGTPQALWD